MSNRATIQPTVFINHPDKSKSYGYRIFDDSGQDYCNVMEESDLRLPPLEFLAKARETFSENAWGIYGAADDSGGIFIGDEWFVWKDNKFVESD